MLTIGVVLAFALLAGIQVSGMIKHKWWRDMIIYGVIFLLTLTYAVLYALDLPILSPLKVVMATANMIYRFLGYHVPE